METNTIQVKDFIITFGIEKLQGKEVEQNGKKYKITLDVNDLEFHSLKNKDWNNSKDRIDRYHSKGNYRFVAINELERCVFVYPSTEILINKAIN